MDTRENIAMAVSLVAQETLALMKPDTLTGGYNAGKLGVREAKQRQQNADIDPPFS